MRRAMISKQDGSSSAQRTEPGSSETTLRVPDSSREANRPTKSRGTVRPDAPYLDSACRGKGTIPCFSMSERDLGEYT